MGQALYRKYRSKSLDEIVGQDDIKETLKQALKQNRLSHAYLFTGPRGVGKTSVARIMAHEINKLPYTDDTPHIDIIEIDAASNRRIDEIRELREKVYVAPAMAKYKVYIIDEVHMLTREAFNALLKTLEEPPAHVIFILATTDAHKLPETIVSRTQRFNFKPVDNLVATKLLKKIAASEKIKISDEALSLLAEHSDGSLRDSVSLLDQAANQAGPIKLSHVQQLLGLAPKDSIDGLEADVLGGSQPAKVVNRLDQLYAQGYQPAAVAKQLSQSLRQKLLSDSPGNSDQILELMTSLIEVAASYNPERFLEISLLKQLPAQPAAVDAKLEPAPVQSQPESEPMVEPVAAADEPAIAEPEPRPARKQALLTFDAKLWPDILKALKQRHNTIYSIVRMAKPDFTDDRLILSFAFPFHQKRINEATNRQLLADIIHDLSGQKIAVECLLDTSLATGNIAPPPEDEPAMNNLSTINSIFGSTELLES